MKYIYFFIKRLFDIIISIIGIVLLIPVSIIVKIMYLLHKDTYTIFYKQKRIGKKGKEFTMYKYRTMIPSADRKLEILLKNNNRNEEWLKYRKFTYDPRVTKVGRILRKLSLDELPQFINVLIGNMSIIGPRPLVKGELDYYNGNHKKYESIRPGITGWWACNGRNSTTYDERLELEYYYIDNCNILMDIKCIIKTIIIIFRGDGY